MSSGKVISLDIGKGNIHLVVGSSKAGVVEVETAITIPTPSGAVKEGAILDRSALAFAINGVIRDNGIKANKAIATVKSSSILTRELTVPDVPEADVLPLVLLEMEQYLPNISRDYRTGVRLIEAVTEGGAKQNKVRVFAMPNTLAGEYHRLFKDCNLKPLALDVHSNALNKLVQRTMALNNGKSSGWDWKLAAFIDLGQELTEISILSPDKLLFTRLIPYGSGHMDSELIRLSGDSESTLPMKKQELVDLNRPDYPSEESRRYIETVRSYVNRVTNEIQTVIQYFSGRVAEKRPDVLYVYGGNAQIKGLSDRMSDALGLPVRKLDDCSSIRPVAKFSMLDTVSSIDACAAVLRND